MLFEDVAGRQAALEDVLHTVGPMDLGRQFVIVEGHDLVEHGSMPQEVPVLCLLGLTGRVVLENADHIEDEVVRRQAFD